MLRLATVLLALSLPAALAPAGETKGEPKGDLSPEAAKAKKAVEDYLTELKAQNAKVAVLDDAKEVAKAFPGRHFVAVHFAEWPIPRGTPEPLKHRNLFVVGKDGKAVLLADTAALEKFFKENTALMAGQKHRELVEVWLRLGQVFHQDGYYKFEIDPGKGMGAKGADGSTMEGGFLNVVPEGGNKGHLGVEVWLDNTGKITKVVEDNKIVQGMRPKCQATRLLDPDPFIRDLCEQDLLVMGRMCEGYLKEQRARASPELQRAIDRVWQRILDEGR
jgi:hypothetical protein